MKNLKATQKSQKEAWMGKIENIETDCIRVNLKNSGPTFFKFISISMKALFIAVENHPTLLCGCDFARRRQLHCQFEV